MIIKETELVNLREDNPNKKIVFVSGSFDLTHVGHVLFFEEAKSRGDILVVAVGEDAALKLKGKDRPILNQLVRQKMIDSLKVVDYVFIHQKAPEGSGFDNQFFVHIFEKFIPDIWVVNTDASEIEYRQHLADTYGIKLSVLERNCPPEFESISTTGLIERIQSLK